MSREDQFNVTVTVGELVLGTFDKKSGGEIDSEELKYRPGAMGAQVSLGGFVNVGNVTVSRLFDLSRDLPNVGALRAAVGRANVTAVVQHLDVDGNVFGKPYTYTGKLKQYTLPDHDSMSSDAAMFELEISSAQMTSAA